jgi:hypothetical protein
VRRLPRAFVSFSSPEVGFEGTARSAPTLPDSAVRGQVGDLTPTLFMRRAEGPRPSAFLLSPQDWGIRGLKNREHPGNTYDGFHINNGTNYCIVNV